DFVSVYPWKSVAPIDYEIGMDITRFEQDAEGNVVLDVFWNITSRQSDRALQVRRGTYRELATPLSQGGRATYDAMITAMNRELLALSRDIAASISKIEKPAERLSKPAVIGDAER